MKKSGLTFQTEDCDGVPQVWVTRGRLTSSLACALDTGMLDDQYELTKNQYAACEWALDYYSAKGLY